ncbi:MAG: PKD domain-containing protein [Candidatus Bathyarchaeia archaeon]|jgi:PKD repeat protein
MIENKKMIAITAIIGILISTFCLIPIIPAQTQPVLSLSPAQVEVTDPSASFTLDYTIRGVTDLWGWIANITWDSQYVEMTTKPVEGDFFSESDHQTYFDATKGWKIMGATGFDVGTALATSGDGTLARLTFKVLKPVASTTITVTAEKLLTNIATGDVLYNPEYTTPISPYPASTSVSTTVSYVPEGGAPVADAGSNQTVNQFTTVVLDASNTVPQDAEDQTYTWTFFDNESRTLTGMTANYNFFWPGTIPITLTVSNSHGSSTAVTAVTVKSITAPVAVITTDNYTNQIFPVNEYIHFSSSESYDPYNVTIVNGNWDFGDGQKSYDLDTSHSYKTAGTYTVTLTVINSAELNATTTKTIVVGDASGATPNPSATDSGTSNSTPPPGTSPTPRGTNNPLSTQSLTLPAIVLYPLIFATVFALGGAAFWLRKKSD